MNELKEINKKLDGEIIALIEDYFQANQKNKKIIIDYFKSIGDDFIETCNRNKNHLSLSELYIDEYFVLIPVTKLFFISKGFFDYCYNNNCHIIRNEQSKNTDAVYLVESNQGINYKLENNFLFNENQCLIDLTVKNPEKILDKYFLGCIEFRENVFLDDYQSKRLIMKVLQRHEMLSNMAYKLKKTYGFNIEKMVNSLELECVVDEEPILFFDLNFTEIDKIYDRDYLIPILKMMVNFGISSKKEKGKLDFTKDFYDVFNGFRYKHGSTKTELIMTKENCLDFIEFFNLDFLFKKNHKGIKFKRIS